EQRPGQEEGNQEEAGKDAEGKARGEEGEEGRPLSLPFRALPKAAETGPLRLLLWKLLQPRAVLFTRRVAKSSRLKPLPHGSQVGLGTARQHRAPRPRARPVRAFLRERLPAWLLVVRPAHDIEQFQYARNVPLLREVDRLLG